MGQLTSNSFWQGKKVLVTGHTGFKGVWLSLILRRFGAQVYGYALAPQQRSLYNTLSGRSWLAGEKIADICDGAALENFYVETQPDITFHLAAQALVLASYNDPIETLRVNVLGTANLLNVICRSRFPQTAVIVTSDKVYQNHESGRSYVEGDSLSSGDPYSASKACAELVTGSFRYSYLHARRDITVKSARAGNVIGSGDWAQNRILPDIIRAFENGENLVLRYPESVRPWQHVLEPLSGYLLLAEKSFIESNKVNNDSFNFGPTRDSCRPVREVAERFISLWGTHLSITEERALLVREAGILHLDSTRAERELGWKPRWNLEQALGATVNGYKALLELAPIQARSILEGQIEAYF